MKTPASSWPASSNPKSCSPNTHVVRPPADLNKKAVPKQDGFFAAIHIPNPWRALTERGPESADLEVDHHGQVIGKVNTWDLGLHVHDFGRKEDKIKGS